MEMIEIIENKGILRRKCDNNGDKGICVLLQ